MIYSGQRPEITSDGAASGTLLAPHTIELLPNQPPIWVDLSFKSQFSKYVSTLLTPHEALGHKGLYLANTVGLVDSDHTATYKVALCLHSWAEPLTIGADCPLIQVTEIVIKPPEFIESSHF